MKPQSKTEKIYSEVDSGTFNIDELPDTELKINPSYYIHNAILRCQAALSSEDVQGGFAQFRLLVENLETIGISAQLINEEEYFDIIKSFKETEEYKGEEVEYAKSMKLANFKMRLIMRQVFKDKTLIAPLTDKKKLTTLDGKKEAKAEVEDN